MEPPNWVEGDLAEGVAGVVVVVLEAAVAVVLAEGGLQDHGETLSILFRRGFSAD